MTEATKLTAGNLRSQLAGHDPGSHVVGKITAKEMLELCNDHLGVVTPEPESNAAGHVDQPGQPTDEGGEQQQQQ